MYSNLSLTVVLVANCFTFAAAQYFPPRPENLTVLHSKFHDGVTISYKEPRICETTQGVKSYSGYLHLPPNTVDEVGESQDYPINTFFWFFESRKDPNNAPLAVWLNGGPGGSSLIGLLIENGPCFIKEDSNSSYLNSLSWNNEVNMLYIDQPVQAGFSYDTPTNCTWDLISGIRTAADFSDKVPEQNNTFLVGTLGSQNVTRSPNSTTHAAHALWHFAQVWFEEFTPYKPNDEKISIWTESYGGKYGPAFAAFFAEQNDKITKGIISGPGTHYLYLDTLGLVNTCIDSLDSGRAYPDMAFNNTYGIQAVNESIYMQAVFEWEGAGGLNDQITACREIAQSLDPDDRGDVEEVNKICRDANEGSDIAFKSYMASKEHGYYDIGHYKADPFPPPHYKGYLSQKWVQEALGVPVNYTESSEGVYQAFTGTGDMPRSGMLQDLSYVLESGIKVAMMFGDRDFACNWIGGERSSLNIEYHSSKQFRSAGYAPIEINPFFTGGQVRQYGNLSFSRVYQSGHMVPSYQAETAYAIFMRAMFNRDVATGEVLLTDEYRSVGSSNTWHIKNERMPSPESKCYVLDPATCTEEQWAMVKNNTAKVRSYFVIGSVDDVSLESRPDWQNMIGKVSQKVIGSAEHKGGH